MIETGPINSTELLSRLRSLSAQAQGKAVDSAAEAQPDQFSNVLKTALHKVNEAQTQASSLGEALEKGDPNVSVADAMIASQKSTVSFQAMVQVRNKLVTAYQEIMSMQI